MKVKTRSGSLEPVSFDKITERIKALSNDLKYCDATEVAQATIQSIYDGITTTELDEVSATICATKSHKHPEYCRLGGRILASNISKTTRSDYSEVVNELFKAGVLSEVFTDFVNQNKEVIQSYFCYERDMNFDYFAMKTLEKSYLLKIKDVIRERPQHLYMRAAVQIHMNGEENLDFKLKKVKETYELLSLHYFTHATPTLFNSGCTKAQLASCHVENTEVFTINGGVKKIQDVEIGDLVITHKNRAMPVVQLHKNPLGDRKIYKLQVEKTKDILVTGNHKFWSYTNGNVEWKRVDEFKSGDYIAIPTWSGVAKESQTMDSDFAKLVGLWLSNGRHFTAEGIGLYARGENNFIQTVCEKFDAKVSVLGDIVLIKSFEIRDVFKTLFSPKTGEYVKNQLYHLLRAHGIYVSMERDDLQSPNMVIGDNKFLRIKSVEETDRKDEFVYTLGVEEDHSYMVEGLLCENCYLMGTEDSIEEIFTTVGEVAKISKWSGGLGLSLTNIRASGSIIKGTNGKSDGIVPLCKTLEATCRYINQCFTPDTLVYGENGLVRMDSVTKGDKLITIDGTLKTVADIFVNDVDKDIRG